MKYFFDFILKRNIHSLYFSCKFIFFHFVCCYFYSWSYTCHWHYQRHVKSLWALLLL